MENAMRDMADCEMMVFDIISYALKNERKKEWKLTKKRMKESKKKSKKERKKEIKIRINKFMNG